MPDDPKEATAHTTSPRPAAKAEPPPVAGEKVKKTKDRRRKKHRHASPAPAEESSSDESDSSSSDTDDSERKEKLELLQQQVMIAGLLKGVSKYGKYFGHFPVWKKKINISTWSFYIRFHNILWKV